MSTARASEKTDARARYEAELSDLYDEYFDRIARYAYVHIGDKSDAEDLAGEVFLKALKSLDSYQERGVPMQAWLFKIAHNLVVDYLRKKTKIRMDPIEEDLPQTGEDPARIAETRVQMESVNKAMERLTSEQRQVITLRFQGGLSSKEVAEIMKKSDGAVREMQRAALEKLRNRLAVEG